MPIVPTYIDSSQRMAPRLTRDTPSRLDSIELRQLTYYAGWYGYPHPLERQVEAEWVHGQINQLLINYPQKQTRSCCPPQQTRYSPLPASQLQRTRNAHTKRLLTSRFCHPNTSAQGPHKNIVLSNTTTSEMHTGVICTLVGT